MQKYKALWIGLAEIPGVTVNGVSDDHQADRLPERYTPERFAQGQREGPRSSSGGSPKKAYGVLALADPFEELVGPYLPRLIHAVLLPFKDKIIYDGLLSGHNITFGGGVKRRLNEEYKEAKEAFGIITSLPEGELPPKKPKTQTKTLVRLVKNRSDACQGSSRINCPNDRRFLQRSSE